MTTDEKVPNRYRKEQECAKRCKEFDSRIKNIEKAIKEEYERFDEQIKKMTASLDKNIDCNKKFQEECEKEIKIAMGKIERSKKEVKRLKRMSIINICFFVLCLIVYYVGF